MKKLLHGLIILLVFTNCNSEVKKQSFTIDYIKSNKWCTIASNHTYEFGDFNGNFHGGNGITYSSYYDTKRFPNKNDTIQTCLEFNDNEIKSFKNGKLQGALEFIFEQKSDNLIAMKPVKGRITSYYRIKSLDTLSLFYTFDEGVYDDEDFVFDLVRVKN